jgi:hypothetical protein
MNEIKLLEGQIKKLESSDFDLKAWKQYTILILERIFGGDNIKIKQIERIEADYSSWSLRDASGKSSHMETCKRLGKEILQAAIDEISLLGIPDDKLQANDSFPLKVISNALESELKVAQIRELIALINNNADPVKRRNEVTSKLNEFGVNCSSSILATILADEILKGKL